ncbi:hypothetical protein ABW21_db0209839 [Orbilia brochopaga]|nr:hypothetical protein ABW21_db0209839 [Drechslerella brochopaga]
MSTSTSTLLTFEAKKGFVLSQIRILSQDILSRLELDYDGNDGDGEPLTGAAMENVLQKGIKTGPPASTCNRVNEADGRRRFDLVHCTQ